MENIANIKSFSTGQKLSLVLLVLTTLFGFFISATMDLSYDETYYWIYSQYLSWGYFDHPPAVAWGISLGTFIFGDNEFGVRFVSNLFLLGTLYFVLKLVGLKKFLEISFLLVLSMPLITLTGLVALPDAPLMFFSTLFFFLIKKYLDEDSWGNAIALAFCIALMFYSKYHGLLIVLLTVCGYFQFLKRKSFWAIVLLVVLLYLPHMYWQYKHEFISFKFHLFGRVEKHFSLRNIFDYIGGQFFLMGALLFPLSFVLLKKIKDKTPFERILIMNSFGFLVFLFFMSFRNQIEANWTISCSVALVILMSQIVNKDKIYFKSAVCLNVFVYLLMRVVMITPETFITGGEENRLNEISGWDKRGKDVLALCDGQKIVADNYQFASRMAYVTKVADIPSLHFGSRESHYKILNLEKLIKKDEKICYLTSKDILNAPIVKTGYKDDIHVVQNTTLDEITKYYGTTYEEIIRE